MRIAFATHAGLEDLTPSDRLAADELHRRGSTVTPVPWSAACDWRRFDAVVIRATWDYYQQPAEFLDWLRDRSWAASSAMRPSSVRPRVTSGSRACMAER